MVTNYSSLDKALHYYIEPEASFGTNVSGSQTFLSLRFNEATVPPEVMQQPLDNTLAAQYLHENRQQVMGLKSSKISIEANLHGAGTALSGTTAPARHDHFDLLGVTLGGYFINTGSAVATNSTVTGAFAVTTNTGPRFPNKTIVGLLISGALQCRPVLSKSTDTIIPHFAFSANPAAGTLVYGAHLAYPNTQSTSSLQFIYQGDAPADNWVLRGMNGNFGIEATEGDICKISWELEGASWSTGSNTQALFDLYPNGVSYLNGDLVLGQDSYVYLYPITSGACAPTPTNMNLKSISFSPAMTYANVRTFGGVETIAGKAMVRNTAGIMTVELQNYFTDRTYYDARTNQTPMGLFIQLGSIPGKTVCLSFPCVQITNVVEGDTDGLLAQTLSIRVLTDTQTNNQGGSSDRTALVKAPFCIAAL